MTTISRSRLTAALAAERQRFIETHPNSRALFERAKSSLLGGVPMNWMVRWVGDFPIFVGEASGAHFTDVDGHRTLDLCLGDTGAMTGHAPPAAVEAIVERVRHGTTFMLPTEDAVWVGEELARRFALPAWQVALTATDANRFALRIARQITGRPKVLVFNPTSQVETYGALRLQVENWRWAGVPFYLRSGKRLAVRDTQISIQFRRPPLLLFREAGVEHIDPNRLDLRIQPDESIAIQMKAKIPGPAIQLRNVSLAFSYKDFGEQPLATGYERLLHDCMIGDASLFHRSDMVEAAWTIATPILDLWERLPARDFPNYAAGTWGPPAGDELLLRDGRRWV